MEFEVTKNLHNALYCKIEAGHYESSRYDDPDEKSSWQVQMMLEIYRLSFRCLVWMGEIRDDFDLTDAEAGVEFCEYIAILSEFEDANAAPVSTFLGSLNDFNRTRTWTVNEAVLPSNLCLVWGLLHMEWNVLSQALENWVERAKPASIHSVSSETNFEFLG
ncbi:uncharacterized protein EAF01_003770 [Botrytis porri]|uniref:uncharacterized protein n=1 Tax=Botrytis porri TaxID=87229 RepID=UPI00190127E7|nr:uncharacterized protein EAF01_003770 [Botrytis porri]KAF7910052.1 hypothetical protein EAF01_003770 [Botrytis porri]